MINARFAKPLDRELILAAARGKALVVTLEESVVTGGFGSAVLEVLEEARLADRAYRDVPLKIVGIPGDRFVDHGSVSDLRRLIRLDAAGIEAQIRETLTALGLWAHPGACGREGRRAGPSAARRPDPAAEDVAGERLCHDRPVSAETIQTGRHALPPPRPAPGRSRTRRNADPGPGAGPGRSGPGRRR